MANHFKGNAYEEHYEKEIKDFTPSDWAVTIAFFGIIVVAVIMGFLQQWGVLVILVGIEFAMFDVLIRVIFHRIIKLLYLFDAIGVITIVEGIFVLMDHIGWVIISAFVLYLIVCFFVGILCVSLGVKKKKKMAEYSLIVQAECETVDEKRINLFLYDDIVDDTVNHALNKNELYKPAFHYFVDGQEYFTESTVYYGDLNEGYKDGERIELRVNPNNPNEVLPKGENASIEMLVGISWLVIGVVCVIVFAVLALLGEFNMFLWM